MKYNIHNPNRSTREFHDGTVLQRRIILPGERTLQGVELSPMMAEYLKGRGDLELTLTDAPAATPINGHVPKGIDTPRPARQVARVKPPLIVDGMFGIGDCIHQRAFLPDLMLDYDVYLRSTSVLIYHDLVKRGLKVLLKPTRLHAQARTIERERSLFYYGALPANARTVKIWYHKENIDRHGSITEGMVAAAGIQKMPELDFSIPVLKEWRDLARHYIQSWKVGTKPIMIYRPIVLRKEWNSASRNPDVGAYETLFQSLRPHFFVVSIADLKPGVEWIVGPEQDADVKLHKGELDFPTLVGLFSEVNLVFANAGFAPVLAQAVGAPCITIYGGRESSRTTERAGSHLAPTLSIDPDHPCDCHAAHHKCDKTISLPPALERVKAFAEVYAKPRKKVLVFGTVWEDCQERAHLTDLWLSFHPQKSPECDFMLVDSASPWHPAIEERHPAMVSYEEGMRGRRMFYDFPDNIGHLSRKGRDGWGRSFCKGLEAAIASDYDYVVHIEGDSLFRLPIMPIIDKMEREKIKVASTVVKGMRFDHENWVETGLIFFDVDYLKRSQFIKRYDWTNRRVAPTPEAIIFRMIQQDLTLMPWKAWRGDKYQINHDNIEGLDLDWVTHCHNDVWAYDKFVGATKEEGMSAASLKVNFGCGTNRITGWCNHDAEVNIEQRLPYQDRTVDFILVEHCVEHVEYKKALEFFKECRRILKPGGVLRVIVPSIEQIMRDGTPDYFRFTQKWQGIGPTARGAMHAIIHAHGHQMAWTASGLECALFYSGFEKIVRCEPKMSQHPELRDVDGHWRVIGDKFNRIESLIMEAS